jgi:predicted ATPase
MVASSGVNVIIETHSDHIINGIQIAVAKNEINNSLLTINYFGNKEGNVQPEIQSISVSELGELAAWPKGFFDQTQVDFAELIKSRKK